MSRVRCVCERGHGGLLSPIVARSRLAGARWGLGGLCPHLTRHHHYHDHRHHRRTYRITVWKEKDERDAARGAIRLEDFLYLYLKKRLGIQELIAKRGYNLMFSLRQ